MLQSFLQTAREKILSSGIPEPVTTASSYGKFNRILIVRPDHLGDVLLAVPALQFLRRSFQEAHIALASGPWSEAIAKHLDDVDQHIQVPFPAFDRDARLSVLEHRKLFEHTLHEWSKHRFDVAILLRDDDWWSAMATQYAGIPVRLGHDHQNTIPHLTHTSRLQSEHWVLRNLRLAHELILLSGSTERIHGFNADTYPLKWPGPVNRPSDTPSAPRNQQYVIVHPGSGASVKLWPDRYWAHVIRHILFTTDLDILITGSDAERGHATTILSLSGDDCSRIHDLTGKTDLDQLAALMSDSQLVLGVDSGPMHIAVSTGVPTIHLYGPSNHITFGPWGDPDQHILIREGTIMCPRCEDLSPERPDGCGCMLAIDPEDVIHAVKKVMEKGN